MLELPPDIIRLVLAEIDDYKTMYNVSLVCKELCRFTRELSIWRILFCLHQMKYKYRFEPEIWATEKGDIGILEWWIKYFFHYKPERTIFGFGYEWISPKLHSIYSIADIASKNGHISVLEWWNHSLNTIELDWPKISPFMKTASIAGHIPILNWWRCYLQTNNIKMQCGVIIDETPHVDVLDWWLVYCRETKTEFEYTVYAVDDASMHGYANVLEWWYNYCSESKSEFKYSYYAIDHALSHCHIPVLEFWAKYCDETGFLFEYNDSAIHEAQCNNYLEAIIWMYQYCQRTGLKFKYTQYTIEYAVKNKDIKSIEWWTDYLWENDSDIMEECLNMLRLIVKEIKQIAFPADDLVRVQYKICFLYRRYLQDQHDENNYLLKSRKIELGNDYIY